MLDASAAVCQAGAKEISRPYKSGFLEPRRIGAGQRSPSDRPVSKFQRPATYDGARGPLTARYFLDFLRSYVRNATYIDENIPPRRFRMPVQGHRYLPDNPSYSGLLALRTGGAAAREEDTIRGQYERESIVEGDPK